MACPCCEPRAETQTAYLFAKQWLRPFCAHNKHCKITRKGSWASQPTHLHNAMVSVVEPSGAIDLGPQRPQWENMVVIGVPRGPQDRNNAEVVPN